MILKSNKEYQHNKHLANMFRRAQHYNMRLNLEKCTFMVKANRFLGFYLTMRGIKVNPNKWDEVIKMEVPTMKNVLMKLNMMIKTLNSFILRSTQYDFLFYILLKKVALKAILYTPSILSIPTINETLFLYLAVSTEVVSFVLIWEEGSI